MQVGASALTAIPASLGGGLTYLGTLAATQDPEAAKSVQESTQEALTYKPTSRYGKEYTEGLGRLTEALVERPTEAAGEYARRGVQTLGGSAQASGATGAAVKTGLQAIPYVLGLRSFRGGSRVSSAAASATESTVDAAGVTSAREFTRSAGVDFESLPRAIQGTLSRMAARGEDLSRLDARALERVARAQSLDVPVPITRAQATRDLGDITEEENLRRTHAGAALRDKMAQQDTALHRNLAALREQVAPGSKLQSSADAGLPVQSAARRKLQVLKGQSTRLYEEARAAGDLEKPISPAPIAEWLKDPANGANAGWVAARIKAYQSPDGTISINNLERIRQEANAATQEGGTRGHFAGRLKEVIDQTLDQVPGAEKYKAARESWKAWNQEFTRQRAIRDLTSEKANVTDRRIALEGTTDYVLKASRESLEEIRDTLTKGGTEKTRARGEKAWRDLQAGIIQKLREEAAGKRAITNEQDMEQFNAAFLDRFGELDRTGKLDVLFGKPAADKLRKIAQTVRDVRTTPADRIAGPNTASRLVAAMETFAHSTGLAFVARGGRAVTEKIREASRAERAAVDPVEEAVRKEKRVARSERAGARAARTVRTLREHYQRGAGAITQSPPDQQP